MQASSLGFTERPSLSIEMPVPATRLVGVLNSVPVLVSKQGCGAGEANPRPAGAELASSNWTRRWFPAGAVLIVVSVAIADVLYLTVVK